MSRPAPSVADCSTCPLTPASGAAGVGHPTAVDRRTFLSQATLAAVATALAACSSASDTTAPTSINGAVRVADYPALASVGGIATLTVGGNPVAIVRTATSTYLALSLVCPHQGSIVGVNGSGFLCPNHQARFSADGTWTGGERTGNLRAYSTTYDASAGTLTIG